MLLIDFDWKKLNASLYRLNCSFFNPNKIELYILAIIIFETLP